MEGTAVAERPGLEAKVEHIQAQQSRIDYENQEGARSVETIHYNTDIIRYAERHHKRDLTILSLRNHGAIRLKYHSGGRVEFKVYRKGKEVFSTSIRVMDQSYKPMENLEYLEEGIVSEGAEFLRDNTPRRVGYLKEIISASPQKQLKHKKSEEYMGMADTQNYLNGLLDRGEFIGGK